MPSRLQRDGPVITANRIGSAWLPTRKQSPPTPSRQQGCLPESGSGLHAVQGRCAAVPEFLNGIAPASLDAREAAFLRDPFATSAPPRFVRALPPSAFEWRKEPRASRGHHISWETTARRKEKPPVPLPEHRRIPSRLFVVPPGPTEAAGKCQVALKRTKPRRRPFTVTRPTAESARTTMILRSASICAKEWTRPAQSSTEKE